MVYFAKLLGPKCKSFCEDRIYQTDLLVFSQPTVFGILTTDNIGK